jgi:K+-transporting ATPase ATPase B chain
MTRPKLSMFDRSLMAPAILESFSKLDPRVQWRNPVMFVVYVGAILTTVLWVQALVGEGEAPGWFILNVAIWLWFTLLFANFAEALAEGRSKAQAAALRGLKQTVLAKKLSDPVDRSHYTRVPATELRRGDFVFVEAGDYVPADGEVHEGAASVDESAITGESAPVIRESGGDFSAVTGGTRVISDWIVVSVTANPGETFIDRMIAMVESAKRQKTPNEIALTILLVALTLLLIQRRRDPSRHARDHHGAHCAPRLPHTDDDWCVAVGHRRRRDEPDDAGERDRDVRTCRRGGRGRGRAAARQDRNHHTR